MATQERNVTDNPYRALGVGSSTLFAALRRKADGAARAASVGLAADVPQQDVFGTIDLSELSSAVRSLDNNPARRTVLRIFWPLSEASIPLLVDGGPIRRSELPDEEVAQLLFLFSWYAFLEDGSPEGATRALVLWQDLYSMDSMDARLVDLLVQEDAVGEDQAFQIVVEAQKTVALHILERVAMAAAAAMDAGDAEKAAKLAKTLLDSPIDDDLEEQALVPLGECGQRLQEQVLNLIREMPDWRLGQSTAVPEEVEQLAKLGEVLSDRHPAATDWTTTAKRWRTAQCWRMRQESLRLNNERQNSSAALNVAQEALRLSGDPEQQAKLREDIAALIKIVEEEKKHKAFDGILAITSAPSLSTVNGIGTKLYGNEPFAPDSRFHFAVLYFVLLFVPVFPLTRYLVEDGEQGGWRFLGKTRWTTSMKVHLAASCIAIAVVWISLANQPLGSAASSSASGYRPTTRLNQPTNPANEQQEIGTLNPSQGDLARTTLVSALETELTERKAEIERLDEVIAKSGDHLDANRHSLESLGARIELNDPDPYSQNEIDDHNAMVDEYERLRAGFNVSVQQHNDTLEERRRQVARHNEIVDKLNALR